RNILHANRNFHAGEEPRNQRDVAGNVGGILKFQARLSAGDALLDGADAAQHVLDVRGASFIGIQVRGQAAKEASDFVVIPQSTVDPVGKSRDCLQRVVFQRIAVVPLGGDGGGGKFPLRRRFQNNKTRDGQAIEVVVVGGKALLREIGRHD